MKRSIAAWTVTAAAAVILGLPTASAAQSAAQPPATTQSAQPPASAPGENAAAREQLRRARTALDDVTIETLSARGKTQVADLKRRLTALERTSKATSKTWGNEVAAMDKIIVTLLASDATPAGTSGTTAPPAAKPTTSTNLDDASRAKLTEVRAALTAYAAAMSGQPAPASAAPSAAPSTASPTATPAEPSASAQPTTPPAQSTATPPASTAPAQPPSAEAAQAQPDQQAARKYLTDARGTLSEMTQLPAAAQLSGDARTQISQLISNFNELITTQTEWRASYAKVNANLTALLGPDSGTPDPSTGSGTAGAVGTSGTTAPNIDPAVRGKLIELRKHLSEFERVASGGAASTSATPSATSGATGTSGMATTPSASSSTSTTTTPAASSATTPSAASSDPAASSGAAQHAESMRLIAAIESMLRSQNEGGGLTLDKTQADMLRTHLADLRRLLEPAKK
ncbi:MAG: hypothetical protein ABIS06_14050 [Vicinamibacterales bacterium]